MHLARFRQRFGFSIGEPLSRFLAGLEVRVRFPEGLAWRP